MKRKVFFSESVQSFKTSFKEVQAITEYVGGEPYHGDYEITPKVNAQEMQTEGKIMLDNVKIKSIPFYNVSNTSGGSTVHIADEV